MTRLFELTKGIVETVVVDNETSKINSNRKNWFVRWEEKNKRVFVGRKTPMKNRGLLEEQISVIIEQKIRFASFTYKKDVALFLIDAISKDYKIIWVE